MNLLGLLMKTLGLAWFNATCLRVIRSGLLTQWSVFEARVPWRCTFASTFINQTDSWRTRFLIEISCESPKVSFFAVLNPTATRSCLVGSGCTSINERSGWWAIGKTFWNANMKTILIWWKRAMVQILVSQGSAWEGNGERTVKFRRCPAAVKPLLALARVSQNARQSLNRRGSTCFFLMCKLFCTNQFFLHLFSFERITGWASKTDKYF